MSVGHLILKKALRIKKWDKESVDSNHILKFVSDGHKKVRIGQIEQNPKIRHCYWINKIPLIFHQK